MHAKSYMLAAARGVCALRALVILCTLEGWDLNQVKATVNWKRVSGQPPVCSLEGCIIWPLLLLLCTAHAQYNYLCLSKHPVFDKNRKC